mmetsp:Transcript_7290/g.20714  ORF Transcript_7290/g.20714 Transcript_7290/m.20714 type:complete len:329 (-) Transcript_7290:384-1370(-)
MGAVRRVHVAVEHAPGVGGVRARRPRPGGGGLVRGVLCARGRRLRAVHAHVPRRVRPAQLPLQHGLGLLPGYLQALLLRLPHRGGGVRGRHVLCRQALRYGAHERGAALCHARQQDGVHHGRRREQDAAHVQGGHARRPELGRAVCVQVHAALRGGRRQLQRGVDLAGQRQHRRRAAVPGFQVLRPFRHSRPHPGGRLPRGVHRDPRPRRPRARGRPGVPQGEARDGGPCLQAGAPACGGHAGSHERVGQDGRRHVRRAGHPVRRHVQSGQGHAGCGPRVRCRGPEPRAPAREQVRVRVWHGGGRLVHRGQRRGRHLRAGCSRRRRGE